MSTKTENTRQQKLNASAEKIDSLIADHRKLMETELESNSIQPELIRFDNQVNYDFEQLNKFHDLKMSLEITDIPKKNTVAATLKLKQSFIPSEKVFKRAKKIRKRFSNLDYLKLNQSRISPKGGSIELSYDIDMSKIKY